MLEVQPYLFVFYVAKFGAFLHFLDTSGLVLGFFGSGSGSKTFLEPTNVNYKFLFVKGNPVFLFLIKPNLGLFCTFWAILVVGVSFKNFFGTYLCRQSTLVL